MATQEIHDLTDGRTHLSAEAGDKELTLSFQRGDRWAYESIYQRYSQRVDLLCRRMLEDPQDAQDAAQETFLRVYQALPRFNGRYHLGAWINRIATNVCLDMLRARSRMPSEVAPNDVLDEVEASDTDHDPEQVLLRSVEGSRVLETLDSLSPLQRRAIYLRDVEGRDYRDIAARLGVTDGRARVLLHRARKGFRKSWSSGWVLVGLPLRLLQRARRMRVPGGERVAEAATSATHATHALSSAPVASCTNALSHCGEVVTERLAAVATAAIVGLSAAGGAVPAAFDGDAARAVAGGFGVADEATIEPTHHDRALGVTGVVAMATGDNGGAPADASDGSVAGEAPPATLEPAAVAPPVEPVTEPEPVPEEPPAETTDPVDATDPGVGTDPAETTDPATPPEGESPPASEPPVDPADGEAPPPDGDLDPSESEPPDTEPEDDDGEGGGEEPPAEVPPGSDPEAPPPDELEPLG